MKKISYFQGGGGDNKPTPKKKKYKSEPAIVVQPRFKEPFYRNYDLYDVEGVNGKPEHGPGTGLYQHMENYESVSDFLKQKRQHLKDKYKADDLYYTESGVKNKIAGRIKILNSIIKKAIDFKLDTTESSPIIGDSSVVGDSIYFGGQTDKYLPKNDLEGKDPSQLNYGRDYSGQKETFEHINELLEKLLSLNPTESDMLGIPQGILPKEDLDSPNDEDIEYGVTNSGNTTYQNFSF